MDKTEKLNVEYQTGLKDFKGKSVIFKVPLAI
jgi:hypothetical protein